jgi:phosphonopyruvate decarboxylase
MIDCQSFYDGLSARGVGFYTGVPDSLLANFCAYVDEHGGKQQHLITANEGNAIALAMGYHMATSRLAVVYMQNSGLGNAINPLTSLADAEVYRVPMLLIIGWRGEPDVKDEPQHVKQGRITPGLLDVLEIPYWILDAETNADEVLDAAFRKIEQRSAPAALLVRKGTFSKYKSQHQKPVVSALKREEALEHILELCDPNALIISTTGKTSRELFELRIKRGESQRDFLTVGGMGHTASIALGVAIGQPEKHVICLDGDGSLLMHMGAMPVIAQFGPKHFLHVLLNNGAHESVGGQATSAPGVDFEKLSSAAGYQAYALAADADSLHAAWQSLAPIQGSALLEIKIQPGSRENLGRPTSTAEQNKISFMKAVHA